MSSFPCLARFVSGSGQVRYRLGDRLVDRYLEFVAGRCRPNTLRAVAFDLKTFFTVIGWATGDNYKTPLIEKAIEMAACNYPLAENAIFHSDRGSNYTSCQFAVTLKQYGLRQSVGRTGICYDNAMAESFFAALKNERVYRTQ